MFLVLSLLTVTNPNGACDFLLVIDRNIGPILHRFWDSATYWLKIANLSYPYILIYRPFARGEPFRISGWTFYCQK